MYEVQDRHCRIARLGETAAYVEFASQGRWEPLTEHGDSAPQIICAPNCGDFPPRPADPAIGGGNRIVTVDHNAQRIGRTGIVQCGNGQSTATEELPVYRHRRQTRQWPAGQHVIGAKYMPVIIEEGFGTGGQVHRSKDDPNSTRIDPLEIDVCTEQNL